MVAVAPLRIARFRSMWAASIVSNIGSFFYTVAASWLMLEMTGSATWVGLIQAANTLPILALALAAGAIADMVDRTRVMLAAQTLMCASAAAMAFLAFSDRLTPHLLLTLGLLIGVGVTFNLPAWQSLVPHLVPRGMLGSAVALNSAGFNVARAVGPALGGLVVAAAGAAVAFGINAASFVGVIIVVLVLGRRLELPAPESSSFRSAIGLGIRYARFTPVFRRLLGLLALFALTSAVVQTVLPSRTRQLGGDADTYGLLLGAMGLGALIGAFVRGPIMERLGERSLRFSVIVFGLAGVTLGTVDSVPLAFLAIAVAGTCWVLTLVTLNTTSQTMTPEWIRGRAMSIYTLALTGVIPIGSILAGGAADLVGAGWAIALFSTGTIALGVAVPAFRIPSLDDVPIPTFTESDDSARHPDTVAGGRVLVISTWTIAADRYREFLEMMERVRLVRLSTGAYRWRLYRVVGSGERFTEAFVVHSWEEHLAQHRRIDDASRELLRRARQLDAGDGPHTRHLVAVDIAHPPNWDEMVETHAEMHQVDGSIPLGDNGDR